MELAPMSIPDAYRLVPERISDPRGEFFEAVRAGVVSDAIGYPFVVRQVNYSVSRRHTIRGIHGTLLPPGQAKLVTCVQGTVLDVVVDLRPGSPSYGAHEVTVQEADTGIAVYLADGLGHAFLALTEDARMCYLCSEEYVPGTMVEVDALDPELALPWPLTSPPIRSPKDAAAPGLTAAAAAGLLASYQQCREWYDKLRDGQR